MNIVTKTLVITLPLSLFTLSQANANTHYDYASVVKTKPVYHYVQVKTPIEQCYLVTKRDRHHRRDRSGATVAGAVIGGVLGNVLGDNRESTVAGAVIGGAIGHASQVDNHRHRQNTRTVEHCETRYERTKKVRKIKGYQVKYRYQGESYKTFMKHYPGDKIKVRVNISPVG